MEELLGTMFAASLRTEEGQFVSCHVVYVDPEKPDPKPPKRIVRDRWTAIRFDTPVSFSVPNITKLAKATDPRTSSFAVYSRDGGDLQVWGLIDQGNRYFDYSNYDADSGPARPGLFQVSIAGLGHLTAVDSFTKIAELKVNVLHTSELDALHEGPVRSLLQSTIDHVTKRVRASSGDGAYQLRGHWDDSIEEEIIASLSRLLLRVQGYRHGGAILISPDAQNRFLRVKHRISYDRLPEALIRKCLSSIQEANAGDEIFEEYLDKDEDLVPMILHLDEVVGRIDLEESTSELDGTLWFISLLSRIDGLVLMGPTMEVRGFGVEINCPDEPEVAHRASDVHGRKLREIDYQHLGTRHRSMMRYCAKVPGALGLVVSQDGDVRAITSIDGKVVLFENLRLQMMRFASDGRRKASLRELAGIPVSGSQDSSPVSTPSV